MTRSHQQLRHCRALLYIEGIGGCTVYIVVVLETVHLFQTCGLRTSLIVCDGSPANLTTIKLSHGHSGAYSVISVTASNDVYEVKPWMVNPFNPPWLIYWMIFPTHQVICIKNCNWICEKVLFHTFYMQVNNLYSQSTLQSG